MKTLKWFMLVAVIFGLVICGFIAVITVVIRADVSGAGAHDSCEQLRGASVSRVDAQFGEPRRAWEEGAFSCPGGLRCSNSDWRGAVRSYAAGLDSSLIAYFDGGVLASCDLSGS